MSVQSSAATKPITIALLGARLNPECGAEFLVPQLQATRNRDAFLITLESGLVWLFDYGVLVGWGVSEADRQALCAKLEPWVKDPVNRPLMEQYSYSVDIAQPVRVHHDMLMVPDEQPLRLLGLSHAFAQSAKLIFFEEKALSVIESNAYISKELARTGKVVLKRRQLSKLRGVLFDTSSDISLNFNLLDTPEFFWDYPELEEDYLKLARYLDLHPRIEILNRKISTIHELLEMLVAEGYHKHSAFLEWIIIWLIAVDILIYFIPK
ncbi:RMD1 family protein [Reinekea marinisedimentorum]|nr:RMD1 family protein [Reinekea marinisedimentorum]